MSFTTPIALSGLNGSNGFRLNGVGVRDYTGQTVAAAGDVNGDGFADILVGAPLADSNGVDSGAVYLVFGRSGGWDASLALSTLDGSHGLRITGIGADIRTGAALASAGDINGDGLDDVIIGNPRQTTSNAYVVFGKTGGWGATLDLTALDGSNGFALTGGTGQAGSAVAPAGDVNGDGITDLIIGAPSANTTALRAGLAHVVFGKTGGWGSVLNLTTLDGSNGFRLSGSLRDGAFGTAVASAGDVNGDGFADLVIGAPGATPNGAASGAAYVVLGKATGWAANLAASALDGSNGFRLDGREQDGAGTTAAGMGDVNGDGFGDLLISAHQNSLRASEPGQAFLVFGKASGWAATSNLSALDGSTGVRLQGVAIGDRTGRWLSPAGDVNADGYADLLVSADQADNTGAQSGSTHLVFGKPGAWDAVLQLSTLDGTSGLRLDGRVASDTSGAALAAGDVDGDGFPDMIIGSPNARVGTNPEAGAVDIWFSPAPDGGIWRGSTLADRLRGSPGHDSMNGGAGADTLDGGAGNDTLIGGAGIDTVSYASAASAVIMGLLAQTTAFFTGGAGADTLIDIENLLGSFYDDTLGGDAATNRLGGGEGDDVLFAWGGNDSLDGSAGNDTLYGSPIGTDTLNGGAGNDVFLVQAAGTVVQPGTGQDIVFVTVEDWTPLPGLAFTALAGNAARIQGGTGADQLVANAGRASLLLGGEGDDTLWGQGQADTLRGEGGQDVLRGSGAADWLEGGAGNDQLVGGAGGDRFIFDSADAGYDQIFDFSRPQGDQIRIAYAGGPTDMAGLTLYEVLGSTVVLFGTSRIDVYGVTGMTAVDFLFA